MLIYSDLQRILFCKYKILFKAHYNEQNEETVMLCQFKFKPQGTDVASTQTDPHLSTGGPAQEVSFPH